MVPAFLVQESESSSAGSPPIAPWDNTLNRAMNALRKKDKLSKSSSAGRVSGKGCSTKWSDYHSTGQKEKITSSSVNHTEAQLQKNGGDSTHCRTTSWTGAQQHDAFLVCDDARLAFERSTGVAPDAQLHRKQLLQRDGGGRIGVSGGRCVGVPGGGCVGVPGGGCVGVP